MPVSQRRARQKFVAAGRAAARIGAASTLVRQACDSTRVWQSLFGVVEREAGVWQRSAGCSVPESMVRGWASESERERELVVCALRWEHAAMLAVRLMPPRLSEAEAAFTPLSCALSGPAYRSRFALPYC